MGMFQEKYKPGSSVNSRKNLSCLASLPQPNAASLSPAKRLRLRRITANEILLLPGGISKKV